MARNRVLTARDVHAVKDADDYRRKFTEVVARKNANGMDTEHHVADPVTPYVNLNRWCADCECGSGVGVHPEWGFALCFACGAEHPITMPDEWREIEAALVARKYDANRNWRGETVAELLAENAGNGV